MLNVVSLDTHILFVYWEGWFYTSANVLFHSSLLRYLHPVLVSSVSEITANTLSCFSVIPLSCPWSVTWGYYNKILIHKADCANSLEYLCIWKIFKACVFWNTFSSVSFEIYLGFLYTYSLVKLNCHLLFTFSLIWFCHQGYVSFILPLLFILWKSLVRFKLFVIVLCFVFYIHMCCFFFKIKSFIIFSDIINLVLFFLL